MKTYFKKIYEKEMFNPKWFGLFFNPFYTIRKGLYNGIKENAPFLTGQLLDFGCGNKPYKHLFNVQNYTGLDIEISGHDHKNELIDVFYDGNKIPFDDNNFDSIFSSEVFEHVPNIDTILRELNRVCKTNGHLLVTIPFIWEEHEIPFDFVRYTSYGIENKLKENGFEILRLQKTTNYINTVFQLWNAFVHQNILKHKISRIFLNPILITPTLIIGILLSKILPKSDTFFHNTVVLAKKTKNKH